MLVQPPGVSPSVAEALQRVVQRQFLVGRRSAPRCAAIVQQYLMPALGALPLDGVTAAHLETYAASLRASGLAPATINRYLSPLHIAFKLYADEIDLRIPRFPYLEERNAREVFFERSEFERTIAALCPILRPPCWFAYFTGWRMWSEVLRLRWDEHVKWDAGTIVLPATMTKGRQARVFPFAVLPELNALLHAQREHTPPSVPWIFHRFRGRPIRNFRKAWAAAIRQAGLSPRVPHDLRRTAARNLIRAGVPEKVVMQLVGWQTSRMLQRYHIVNEDDLRAAVMKLASP
jgi:integrase